MPVHLESWQPDIYRHMTTYTRYMTPYPMPCHMGSYTEYIEVSWLVYHGIWWFMTARRSFVSIWQIFSTYPCHGYWCSWYKNSCYKTDVSISAASFKGTLYCLILNHLDDSADRTKYDYWLQAFKIGECRALPLISSPRAKKTSLLEVLSNQFKRPLVRWTKSQTQFRCRRLKDPIHSN